MTEYAAHLPGGPLAERLRPLGVLAVTCDTTGRLHDAPVLGRDWLADLLVHDPSFRLALAEAVPAWNDDGPPLLTELRPGVYVSPIPVLDRRRHRGYTVVILPTRAVPVADEADRVRLASLPAAVPTELERTARLVRLLVDDHRGLRSERQALECVGRQLAESYEEMHLLYTLIQSTSVVERPERFVAITCEELLATLPYAWIGVIFADDAARLNRVAGEFITAGDVPSDGWRVRELARNLLRSVARPRVLLPSTNPRDAEFDVLGHPTLIQPIIGDQRVLGLYIAGAKQNEAPASTGDIKLMGAAAHHTRIFLENAALYEEMNAMFLGTLEAITASIDAKDRYTCGHSRRVAHLTQQLARAIGLDETQVSRTHIAGLVHDVGKIGVPEHVLLKPGRLTPREFASIRRHPEMGHGILKDIPQFRDVLPGVLHHHERWDGTGYPAGLAGEAIPRLGRLIALADAFDAMSSNRTYRSGRARREVLQEITREAGRQFDPELAAVFVSLNFEDFDEMVAGETAREAA